MNQYLISVIVTDSEFLREQALYRVPVESRFKDVIEMVKSRSELRGTLRVVSFTVVRDLTAQEATRYPALFDPQDITDQPLPE